MASRLPCPREVIRKEERRFFLEEDFFFEKQENKTLLVSRQSLFLMLDGFVCSVYASVLQGGTVDVLREISGLFIGAFLAPAQ